MLTLAAGLDYVDLNFLGVPEIIATAVLHHASGVAVIDPGPSTTHESFKDVQAAKAFAEVHATAGAGQAAARLVDWLLAAGRKGVAVEAA